MFDKEINFKMLIFSVLMGVGAAITLGGVLLLAGSAILSMTYDPLKLLFPVGISILYLSCFGGGIVSELFGKTAAASLISGGAMTLLVFLVSCFFQKERNLGALALIFALAGIVLAFFLGGLLLHILSAKYPKRGKRRRR